jgi:membrane-associated protease RseP (regulator of RpoE activity)
MVDQDAPAGRAGVREHDVILSINGEPVQGVEQLRRMIREIPPGRSVTIGISREGEPLTVKADLAHRKDYAAVAPEFKFVMPNLTTSFAETDAPAAIVVVHSSGRSGLMVENLSPQLSDYFGAKDGHGILVRSVEKGSYADKSGFHAGDVIVRVNGHEVNDAGDFGQALRNRSSNTVSINIVRGRKEQTLVLTLPEIKHTGFQNVGIRQIGARNEKEISDVASQLAAVKPQLDLAFRRMEVIRPEIEQRAKEEMSRLQQKVQDEIERLHCAEQEEQNDVQRQEDLLQKEQGGQQQMRELVMPRADI